MTKKTQTESPAFNPEEFTKLWQDKWAQMMKEKGWPETMAMPSMGQMPFFMPFMPGFSSFAASADTGMENRIDELEKRIAVLEKKLTQRNTGIKKKPVAKG